MAPYGNDNGRTTQSLLSCQLQISAFFDCLRLKSVDMWLEGLYMMFHTVPMSSYMTRLQPFHDSNF